MSRPRSVTLISPSGAVSTEALQSGLEALQGLGIDGRVWPGATDSNGYFAGDHQSRAGRLRGVLCDTEGPIWMIRGGYGAIHTLHHAMPIFGRSSPRELWGFSDGTALLAAWAKHGWPAWHGPPVVQLPRLDGESLKRLREVFFDGQIAPFENLETLQAGVARGPLSGGNLSVLVSMVGTPYEADLSESVLLLEDVGEPAYKVDRLFTQLCLSGALERVSGLVLGQFTDISAKELEKIRSFFIEASASLGVPALWGMPVGHGSSNAVVPMGKGGGFYASMVATDETARLEFVRG